mmetsp:Transcript_67189/g.212744  ORF Transcript_67189/g.212744 Transcript_67189/m.212744 type:complete len:253 (-) Transcript_67189:186-944(-)
MTSLIGIPKWRQIVHSPSPPPGHQSECPGASARCREWQISWTASEASFISASLKSDLDSPSPSRARLSSVGAAAVPPCPPSSTNSFWRAHSTQGSPTCTCSPTPASAPRKLLRCHRLWITTLRKQLYSPVSFRSPPAPEEGRPPSVGNSSSLKAEPAASEPPPAAARGGRGPFSCVMLASIAFLRSSSNCSSAVSSRAGPSSPASRSSAPVSPPGPSPSSGLGGVASRTTTGDVAMSAYPGVPPGPPETPRF